MDKFDTNAFLKATANLLNIENATAIDVGNKLVELGADNLQKGGFWIWDIANGIEFYSPNFIKSLGFNDENDFPFIPETWQKYIFQEDLKLALEKFKRVVQTKGKDIYKLNARYNTNHNSVLKVICSGLPVFDKNDKPIYLIGSHKLI